MTLAHLSPGCCWTNDSEKSVVSLDAQNTNAPQRTWMNSCVSLKSIFDARATNSAISSTAKLSTDVECILVSRSVVVHTRELTCVKRNVAGQLRVDAVISFPKHHRHVKIVGNSRAESVLDNICSNWVFAIETEFNNKLRAPTTHVGRRTHAKKKKTPVEHKVHEVRSPLAKAPIHCVLLISMNVEIETSATNRKNRKVCGRYSRPDVCLRVASEWNESGIKMQRWWQPGF